MYLSSSTIYFECRSVSNINPFTQAFISSSKVQFTYDDVYLFSIDLHARFKIDYPHFGSLIYTATIRNETCS